MSKRSNLVFVLGVLLSFSLAVLVAGQARPKTGLFPFGDSNYDVGNKKYVTTAFLPSTTWPYGRSVDRPSGRYSDGKIVPDFIANFLTNPLSIPPALEPNANLSRGAGFAVGGATVLDGPSDTLTLSQQVEKFGAMKSNWDENFLPLAIFMVQIGTEDYLKFSANNPNANASAQQDFVTSVTDKIRTELINLYNLGARKFAYQTLPPIGCFPIVKQEHELEKGDCYEPLNELAKQHNAKIRPMLADLAKTYKGFQYTYFDFYAAISQRLAPASAGNSFNEYRFSNTVDACCGIGSRGAFGCGDILVHSDLCDYPRAFLFYDGKHNSEKANEQIALLFNSADKNVVGPMNIRELSVYPVGMNMLEK